MKPDPAHVLSSDIGEVVFWEDAHARAIAGHIGCVAHRSGGDAVPKFNVEQTCRRAGEVSASLGYLELPTCLEMAKQAKELPEASKMGTSGQR